MPAKVLVVDDDPVLRQVVLAALGSAGHAAAAVGSAEEALDRLPDGWDAVVTDIGLPGIDGLELLRRIRRRHPELPVLVLTGSDQLDHAVVALRNRATEFLRKPVAPAELVGAVEEAVRTSAARRRHVVLAVGAHPDDVEIGCGGTLARHVAAGDEVHVLTLSAGTQGGDGAARRAEAAAAATELGVSLRLADLPDTRISDGVDTIAELDAAIAAVTPSIVYTHSVHDAHQDHRNISRATLVAARRVDEVLAYQAPSTTVAFEPTRFVDISDHLLPKLASLAAYGSQKAIRPYLEDDVIVATARYWSRSGAGRFVEAFELLRSNG